MPRLLSPRPQPPLQPRACGFPGKGGCAGGQANTFVVCVSGRDAPLRHRLASQHRRPRTAAHPARHTSCSGGLPSGWRGCESESERGRNADPQPIPGPRAVLRTLRKPLQSPGALGKGPACPALRGGLRPLSLGESFPAGLWGRGGGVCGAERTGQGRAGAGRCPQACTPTLSPRCGGTSALRALGRGCSSSTAPNPQAERRPAGKERGCKGCGCDWGVLGVPLGVSGALPSAPAAALQPPSPRGQHHV